MTDPREVQFVAFLRSMIERKIGIYYAEGDADIFTDKVIARARECGYDSLLDYYYLLRYDDPDGRELAGLIDSIVVNESYLFRESVQLKLVAEAMIPELIRDKGRARLWSAACASGEEPFSLAMMLRDAGAAQAVEIVATDVSDRCLERARRGVLSTRALRPIAPSLVDRRWFDLRDGRIQIAPEVVSSVDFRRVNLLDKDAIQALGRFDIVFCRNVLIYFRELVATEIVALLYEALLPGGVLFVGISESLLRLPTPLVCEERNGVFFYRRPA